MEKFDLVIIGAGVIGLTTTFKVAIKNLEQNSEQNSERRILVCDMGSSPQEQNQICTHTYTKSINQKSVVENENSYNFHPSASVNAAGLLASNGATLFRSSLRKELVSSMREYPQFLDEINSHLPGEGKINIQTIPDYHLYQVDQPVENNRYQELLKRMSFEAAVDGVDVPVHELPDHFSTLLAQVSLSEIKVVKFNKNQIISIDNLLTGLVVALKKLGVNFYWNQEIKSLEMNDYAVNLKTMSNDILADQVILTTGWNHLLDRNLESSLAHFKDHPGLIETYRSLDNDDHSFILRPGGKNYLIKTGSEYRYCRVEKNEREGEWNQLIANFLKQNNARLEEEHFGIRSVGPSRKPFIKRVQERVVVAKGFDKLGIGIAPRAAQQILSLLG